jgi:hypothetical protein
MNAQPSDEYARVHANHQWPFIVIYQDDCMINSEDLPPAAKDGVAMRTRILWPGALLLALVGCVTGCQLGYQATTPNLIVDPAVPQLMAGDPLKGTVVDHCDDPVSMLETSALNTLCELFGGGSTCISASSQCNSYRRELYAGSTLAPPGTWWNGRGGSGQWMADAAVCTLRELSSAKGLGPITSQAPPVNIGIGNVTVTQEVGYLDFDRTTGHFKGYRKLNFHLPVLGKFDGITQDIDLRRVFYSTGFSQHPYAGSYLIDAGYGLDLATEQKERHLTITPPAFDVVTPIGTFQAQPNFGYESHTAVSDAPWVVDHTDISLPPDVNGDPVYVRLADVYGVIPGVEATTANAPGSGLVALKPYRTGWTSQIALGTRGTGQEKVWSAPANDPFSRPDYDPFGVLDFAQYASRSAVENEPSLHVKASASLKYPENPKDLLPSWVFGLPGLSATAYIKVTPTIEAGAAGQFGLALSEGTNYLRSGEFGVNQSRFAALGLYSGVKANASFYIDTELRIKVSADFCCLVGEIDLIDINPHFPIPLAGGMPAGSAVRLASATSSSMNPVATTLDALTTFGGAKSNPKAFIDQCYAKENDTPPEDPPTTPTEKGKLEDLSPQLWPCNICIATDAVIAKDGSGKMLQPAHSEFLSPASSLPAWKCDAKAKSGCMELCTFDPLANKLTVVKDPDQIAADIPANDPQHNFFLSCKNPPMIGVVVLVKQSPSGDTPVPVTTNIAAGFSAPLDVNTVNTSTVTLNPSVRGTVSYDGSTQTVTFTPSAPLAAGVTYTVIFSRGISDMRGNHLASDVTWSFITEPVRRLP